jgi:NitT/TauT family transport system substrate-binding protein
VPRHRGREGLQAGCQPPALADERDQQGDLAVPGKIGIIDQAAWTKTVEIALKTKNAEGKTVLTKQPEGVAYTNDYVQKAVDKLTADGVDVTGASFKPETVTLKEGGA